MRNAPAPSEPSVTNATLPVSVFVSLLFFMFFNSFLVVWRDQATQPTSRVRLAPMTKAASGPATRL